MAIASWVVSTSKTFAIIGVTSLAVPYIQGEVCNFQSTVPLVIYQHDCPPATVDKSVERFLQFQILADKWKYDQGYTSSITAISMSDAYQKIIGMGPEAIPMIVDQLKREKDDPYQWFWALRAISGVDPVKPEDRGDFLKLAESWIAWSDTDFNG